LDADVPDPGVEVHSLRNGSARPRASSSEATFLTDRIIRLILYEPPLPEPVGKNLATAARIEEMVRKGELQQALTFQTEIVKQLAAPSFW
jgi:hypothetical protein